MCLIEACLLLCVLVAGGLYVGISELCPGISTTIARMFEDSKKNGTAWPLVFAVSLARRAYALLTGRGDGPTDSIVLMWTADLGIAMGSVSAFIRNVVAGASSRSGGGNVLRNKSPTECHLLKLPAELRNAVYDLVFDFGISTAEVDIFNAKPASTALVFTCKQIYADTRLLYADLHREFLNQHFTINIGRCEADFPDHDDRAVEIMTALDRLFGLRGPRARNINHLAINYRNGNMTFTLKDKLWVEGIATGLGSYCLPYVYKEALEKAWITIRRECHRTNTLEFRAVATFQEKALERMVRRRKATGWEVLKMLEYIMEFE